MAVLKTYISSTYTDMRAYRERAFDTVQRLDGFQVLGVEYFRLEISSQWRSDLRAVAASDLFVLILGFRYGYIPPGFNKSITELEFEEVLKRGVPTLAFVLSDDVPLPRSALEDNSERAHQLELFKQELFAHRVVARIRSPDEFSSILASSLANFRADIESRQVVERHDSLAQRLRFCQEESERYKRVIEDLNVKLRRVVPADPIWRGRKFEIDGLMCFALMPFKDEFFEVYETAIVPAAEKQGLRALHAGEIFGNREIVEDIWDSICSARVIVADVTGRNPNVFYELGICHILGKECIVITQEREDVPFDIRHRRFIEYEPSKLVKLQSGLAKTIQAVLTTGVVNEIGP
jgi:hypothetical protein